MSLGSRITKRGKAAIVASLASTPREPLLFLYPQWIRSFSTTASDPTFARSGRPSILSARNYTNHSTIQSNAATGIRADSPHETDAAENERDVASDQTVDEKNHGKNPAAEEGTLVATGNFKVHRESTGTKIRKYAALPKPSVNQPFTKIEAAVRSKVSKALRNREQAKISALSKSAIRKEYQADKREQKQSWIPDWRILLADLRKNTPQNNEWLHKAVYISVPESAVGTLFHGVDDNMWDIAERYGCSVELTNRDSIREQFNEFLLSGPARAISKAAAEVMRISPGSKIKARPKVLHSAGSKATTSQLATNSDDELSNGAKARIVRSERRGAIHATRAEGVLRPSEWTPRTLADYVDNLTSKRLPNHMHHLLYKKGEDHVRAVVKILREILTDPECRSSMSRTAFKTALDYFMKTSHIVDARVTFVHMEMMGIRMDPEVFNIMLRGAAKNEDLHNFHFILHLMLKRGISPNGMTWVAFLMANADFRIKSYIVAAMKEKGLLAHRSVLRGVCEQLITQEVSASLDLGQSQEEFLQHMDSRYGYEWLTVNSGNRVLHALGARHLISRCWEFLQAMEARHVKIDQVSVNTILNHCKQATNVNGGVEIMKRLSSLIPFQPDQTTYHALFELAWRSRSYNLARVVWKYACLNAATTRRMRMLVYQSLKNAINHTLSPDSSQYGAWKKQIGIVIISNVCDYPTTYFLAIPSDDQSSQLELECTSGKQSGVSSMNKRTQHAAIEKLLKRDCEFFQHWVPTRPFGEMLEEAWERDRAWHIRMRDEWAKLDWKLQGAIDVPLHRSNRSD